MTERIRDLNDTLRQTFMGGKIEGGSKVGLGYVEGGKLGLVAQDNTMKKCLLTISLLFAATANAAEEVD
jgi:hypothetical protein